jgi:hypothetical protein
MSAVTIPIGSNLGRNADERAEFAELERLADIECLENWDDPAWRAGMLRDLAEATFEGFEHEQLLDKFSTVETVGEFEPITIEEVTGLEVFWVSLGGQIDQSRLTERVWFMPHDYVGWHVEELEDKVRSGFSRSVRSLQTLGIQQMDAAINKRLFNALREAIPTSGPGSEYYVPTAGLTKAVVDTAIREVQDETLDDTVSIIGRATMIGQLLDEIEGSGLYDQTSEEILRTGRLAGTYRGANIIQRSFFPNDELWVVGRDASKTGFFGGMRAWEWVPPGTDYFNYQARRKAGFVVHHKERARRIVDTSL